METVCQPFVVVVARAARQVIEACPAPTLDEARRHAQDLLEGVEQDGPGRRLGMCEPTLAHHRPLKRNGAAQAVVATGVAADPPIIFAPDLDVRRIHVQIAQQGLAPTSRLRRSRRTSSSPRRTPRPCHRRRRRGCAGRHQALLGKPRQDP